MGKVADIKREIRSLLDWKTQIKAFEIDVGMGHLEAKLFYFITLPFIIAVFFLFPVGLIIAILISGFSFTTIWLMAMLLVCFVGIVHVMGW